MPYKDLSLNAWPNVGNANTSATEDWLENSETIGDYLEAGVPTDGILIDADFSLNALYALTDCLYINFEPWTPTGTYNIGFNSSGEFVVRDGAGNSVVMTSGGSLNAGSIGGITGDFGTGSETFEYDDAGKKYIAYDSDTNKAQLEVENILHEEVVLHMNIHGGQIDTASGTIDSQNGTLRLQGPVGATGIVYGIPLLEGDRIKQVELRCQQTTAGASYAYVKSGSDGGAPTTLGTSGALSVGSWDTATVASINYTVPNSGLVFIEIAVAAAATVFELESIRVTYDRIT